jgi:hypothetical protein
VNIDWLEVSCEESNAVFPCNAEYFRSQGYFVHERDYGTRVWGEVFTIEDNEGHDWIEVRRNPPSGNSEFKGLTEFSCRLRLVNAQCYHKDCVQLLREFMLRHDYIFKAIFRIDICYDFEYFDYGDQPSRFARRILERKYRKINQCKIHAIGDDRWSDYDWETLSWGSPTSMVSTKFYNKSKEIETVSTEKVYIPYAWFLAGLLDNPVSRTKIDAHGKEYKPEIWRVEFSLKSKAKRWLVIEDVSGKRMKKTEIPHTLDLYDAPDKLWRRFQDLAFHYFHFKVARYKEVRKGLTRPLLAEPSHAEDRQPIRKSLCPDKLLFRWDKDHQFEQLDMKMRSAKPNNTMEILRRHLQNYRAQNEDVKQREAADIILEVLDREDLRRYTPKQVMSEIYALQETLRIRMRYPEKDLVHTLAEIQKSFFDDERF